MAVDGSTLSQKGGMKTDFTYSFTNVLTEHTVPLIGGFKVQTHA